MAANKYDKRIAIAAELRKKALPQSVIKKFKANGWQLHHFIKLEPNDVATGPVYRLVVPTKIERLSVSYLHIAPGAKYHPHLNRDEVEYLGEIRGKLPARGAGEIFRGGTGKRVAKCTVGNSREITMGKQTRVLKSVKFAPKRPKTVLDFEKFDN